MKQLQGLGIKSLTITDGKTPVRIKHVTSPPEVVAQRNLSEASSVLVESSSPVGVQPPDDVTADESTSTGRCMWNPEDVKPNMHLIFEVNNIWRFFLS